MNTTAITLPTTATVVSSLLNVTVALIIVGIGYLIAKIVEKLTRIVMLNAKVDKFFEKRGWRKAMLNISITNLAATIIKWYIILIALREAFYWLGLSDQLIGFLTYIINGLPGWILGIAIFFGGLLIAKIAQESVKKSEIFFGDIVGGILYGIIVYFTIIMTLPKFGIDTTILADAFRILLWGLSIAIGIALGLSFGIALVPTIKKFLKRIR